MTQNWYKNSINRYGWKGVGYKKLMLGEERGDSYISDDYFQKDWSRLKYKHLPVEVDAKLIRLDVNLVDHSKLIINTNLMKGTEQFHTE